MKDVLDKITTAYFDVNLRMTTDQLNRIVIEELKTQIHASAGTPIEVLQAMLTVLEWYDPEAVHYPKLKPVDWRQNVQ